MSVGCPRCERKQTPNRDRRWVANVITKLYATSDPRFSTGFKMSTNVGAGCGCHPTGEQSSLFSSSLSTCLARPVGGFLGTDDLRERVVLLGFDDVLFGEDRDEDDRDRPPFWATTVNGRTSMTVASATPVRPSISNLLSCPDYRR